MPDVARASARALTGATLGFPGENYTTPRRSRRPARSATPPPDPNGRPLEWAVDRTVAMGLADLTFHAGFLPQPGDPGRMPSSRLCPRAGRMAADKGVTLAFETGQESAVLLR